MLMPQALPRNTLPGIGGAARISPLRFPRPRSARGRVPPDLPILGSATPYTRQLHQRLGQTLRDPSRTTESWNLWYGVFLQAHT